MCLCVCVCKCQCVGERAGSSWRPEVQHELIEDSRPLGFMSVANPAFPQLSMQTWNWERASSVCVCVFVCMGLCVSVNIFDAHTVYLKSFLSLISMPTQPLSLFFSFDFMLFQPLRIFFYITLGLCDIC